MSQHIIYTFNLIVNIINNKNLTQSKWQLLCLTK